MRAKPTLLRTGFKLIYNCSKIQTQNAFTAQIIPHRIFGNYSDELCTLDIVKNLSQWTFSVLFAAYRNWHLNYRCVNVWRSYKEEEDEEEEEEVFWCKSEALEQGKKKRPWPEQGRRARNHLSRCTRDIMCMATYTAAKCQPAKSARHVAIHAVCTRMLSRAGREECKTLLDCFLHCSSRTCLVMASTRRTIPP